MNPTEHARAAFWPAVMQVVRPRARMVLDIGAGRRPQTLVTAERYVCAEPWGPSWAGLMAWVNAAPGRDAVKRDWAGVLHAWPAWALPTPDLVTLLDVVEHLDKRLALGLLDQTRELVGKNGQVVVFTPLGFIPQGATEGNPLNVHVSAWQPEDFGDGWRVFMCRQYHGRRGGAFCAVWG